MSSQVSRHDISPSAAFRPAPHERSEKISKSESPEPEEEERPERDHQRYATGEINKNEDQVWTSKNVSGIRFRFALLLVMFYLVGVLGKTVVLNWLLKYIIRWDGCDSKDCYAAQFGYRISLGLFFFFLLHVILSSNYNCFMTPHGRRFVNKMTFFIKVPLLILLIIATFFIPNVAMVVYAWLALILSALFLIMQVIIVLHFAYELNDAWGHHKRHRFRYALLLVTFAVTLVSLGFIVVAYIFYGSSTDCVRNIVMISVTAGSALLYFVLSFIIPNGALPPSASIFGYTTYLLVTALIISPPGSCNDTALSNRWIDTIFSLLLTSFFIGFSTTKAGMQRGAFQLDKANETDDEMEASSFTFFHIILLLASGFLAMLIADWSIVGSPSKIKTIQLGNRIFPMWLKFSVMMLCILLYLWTLVVPLIFKQRHFEWNS